MSLLFFFMRLPSHLVLSRHGVFYLRLQSGGIDRRVSLRTKDPKKAIMAAYGFGLAKMSSPGKISELIVKHTPDGALEIRTDGTAAENQTAVEISNMLYQARIRLAEIQAQGNQQLSAAQIQEALLIQAAVQNGQLPAVSQPGPLLKRVSLRDAVAEYLPEIDKSGNEAKTIRQAKSKLNQLVERLGADFDMSDFTNENIEKLWMSPRLQEVEGTTVKKELSWINEFSRWASKSSRKYCPAALTLNVPTTHINPKKYLKFSADDLRAIFEALPSKAETAWKFWIPVIGLYTGARIGEPAALEVDHFYTSAGVQACHMPGTKTDDSARDIPLHPDLISIGLLEFVENRRRTGKKYLFELVPSNQNGWGDKPTGWFGPEFLRPLGITNPQKVFHSFRHTMIDHLRQLGVNGIAARQYVGHDHGKRNDVHAGYGDPLGIPALKEQVLDKINFQKYCGWAPDIQALRTAAAKFMSTTS